MSTPILLSNLRFSSSLFPLTLLGLSSLPLAGCNGRTLECIGEECDAPPPMPPRPSGPFVPQEDYFIGLGKGGQPFMPDGESSGVKVDPASGALSIDPGSVMINNRPVIWVANSQEGTVSKIDTRTLTETARYYTGPKGQGNDPSRTTVGLNGDVVVANRSGGGAVHIAGDLSQCKDKNGDGKITTSNGPGDVKPWGQDECVLWYVDLPASSYPRAAVFDAQYGLDGQLSTTVYIGTYSGRILYRIDATTGRILKEIPLGNATPYGAVIDKNGVVWMYNPSGRELTFVEVNKGDRVGSVRLDQYCAYGITADPEGRIWTSGSGCVGRYTPDPMAGDPAKGKWDFAMVPGGSFLRGLAVDAKKTVWIANTSTGVFAMDTETMMVKHNINLGAGSNNFIGMAIDFDGMVWSINNTESRAYKIDPADVNARKSVGVGMGPYTYSDMTGFQLRNAAAPVGKFRHTFVGCDQSARWSKVYFEVSHEGGTSILVSARTGKDARDLAAQPFVQIAQNPTDRSPASLDKLGARQVGKLLQVEVHLRTVHPAFSPRLTMLKVAGFCNLLK